MLIVSMLDCEHNQWNKAAGKVPKPSSSDNSSFQSWIQKWDINLRNVFSCHIGTYPVKKPMGTKRFWAQDDTLIKERLFSVLTRSLLSTDTDLQRTYKQNLREDRTKRAEDNHEESEHRVQQKQTMQTCRSLLWKSRCVWRKAKGLTAGWQWESELSENSHE